VVEIVNVQVLTNIYCLSMFGWIAKATLGFVSIMSICLFNCLNIKKTISGTQFKLHTHETLKRMFE